MEVPLLRNQPAVPTHPGYGRPLSSEENEKIHPQTSKNKLNKMKSNFNFDQRKNNLKNCDESDEAESLIPNFQIIKDRSNTNLAINMPHNPRLFTLEVEKISTLSYEGEKFATLNEFINSESTFYGFKNPNVLSFYSSFLCLIGYLGVFIQVLAYREIDIAVIFNIFNDLTFIAIGLMGLTGLIWSEYQNSKFYYKVLYWLLIVSLALDIINCLTSTGLALIFLNVIIGCAGDDCDYLISAGISGLIMTISMIIFNVSLTILTSVMISRFSDSKNKFK